MAYTTPRTWADETIVNASDLNTEIRDNVSALYSMANAPYRNLLYNGAMQIAQRGTSTASITTTGYYTADRWSFSSIATMIGTWTNSVENDAPTGSGFRKSLKALCTTANASPSASASTRITMRIEGQDVQRVAKGTSDAQKLALSFWVKANVTGTYIAELFDSDNSRQVSAAYTIDSSGTWEKKTIVFPEDITGVFDNDNNLSLGVFFWLAVGSNYSSGTLNTSWAASVDANRVVGQTNLAAATSNYWQITGVQLETGPIATPFEFLPFGDELARCQRYYQRIEGDATVGIKYVASGSALSTTVARVLWFFPVTMRAAPSVDGFSGLNLVDGVAAPAVTNMQIVAGQGGAEVGHFPATSSSLTQFRPYLLRANASGSFFAVSAEL